MNNEIAYNYIRRASKKMLIVLSVIFLIIVALGVFNSTPLGNTEEQIFNMKLLYFSLLALPLLGIIYSIVMLISPGSHQAFWRLKRYGSAESIAAQIDADARRYAETIKLSKAGYHATFTPSWLIWSRGVMAMQIRILNFQDIENIYKHTVVTNGVAQYSLAIKTHAGKKTNMNFYRNEPLISQVMQMISQHAPTVRVGYDG